MKRLIASMTCLVVLTSAWLAGESTTQPADLLSAQSLEAQTIAVAPKCVASTIGIVSTIEERDHVGVASGSGVIISPDGLILTAGHVIQKPGNILTLRFMDGMVLHGVAVGLDHATDTGLARITDAPPAGGWAYCTMAPDDSARLGEWVLATGNPGSIVVDRNPPLRIGRVSAHDARVIGSNCALEPGDSGGPLFDLAGRVVGINSRILTTSGDTPLPEFLSWHVPISEYHRQWNEMLAGMNANPQVNLDSRAQRPEPVPGISNGTRAALNEMAAQHDAEAVAALEEEKKTKTVKLSTDLMTRALRLAAKNERAGVQPPATQRATDEAAQLALAQVPLASSTTQPVATNALPPEARDRARAQLKEDLLRQYPDAILSDELLSGLLDRSKYDAAAGRVSVTPSEQDLREMGIVAEGSVRDRHEEFPGDRASVEARKTSLQTMAQFGSAISIAGDCVVVIRDGSRAVLLGAIVDGDGWIVSKASDLPASPKVALPDGRVFKAKVVGKDPATDLALLKVNASGLTPVRWTVAAPLGGWVAAPTADPNRVAVGVVSLSARRIGETFAHFQGEQKVVLGVGFAEQGTVIDQIIHDMPAEAAGMHAGDEVFELNGRPIHDHAAFLAELKKAKAGDTLSIKVRRGGQEMELRPVIGQAKTTAQTASGVGETDNVAGGKLSKRRTNFPLALQTDAAIWADECGGPLINLHGETIGIVIARYDRICTFVLPAEVVRSTVEKLKQVR